jgi:hypothetical protein
VATPVVASEFCQLKRTKRSRARDGETGLDTVSPRTYCDCHKHHAPGQHDGGSGHGAVSVHLSKVVIH